MENQFKMVTIQFGDTFTDENVIEVIGIRPAIERVISAIRSEFVYVKAFDKTIEINSEFELSLYN